MSLTPFEDETIANIASDESDDDDDEETFHGNTTAPTSVQDVFEFVVDEHGATERLDKWLTQQAQGQFSRQRIAELINEGHVSVGGEPFRKVRKSPKLGQSVQLHLPELQALVLQAEPIPLNIVFEDAHVLVVNKPTGMLTHPTGTHKTGTLVNALLHHCQGNLSGINGVIRPGIVHRLDRETEGLMVVAKSNTAHHHLCNQLRDRSLSRRYKAIVQGTPSPPQGSIEAPIARHPQQRTKMRICPEGRHALTHYRVLETAHNRFSLVECKLATGRTHQIRLHMAHIGHPLLGDPYYGTGIHTHRSDLNAHEGQALQAFHLGFIHPITHEALQFDIPPSAYMTRLWESVCGI
ncbi:MAG: RluA family pseudouridine synthase [Vampirovibrionales bacterium]